MPMPFFARRVSGRTAPYRRNVALLLGLLVLAWAGRAVGETTATPTATSTSTPSTVAQTATTPAADPPLQILYIDDVEVPIDIDGTPDEAIWQRVEPFDALQVIEPDSLAKPRWRTLTRLFYTPRGLYVAVWNEQPRSDRVSRLSARDAGLNRDGVELVLDPSGRGLYGYYFNVNLGGTLTDGTVRPERNFSSEWDGPWEGATAESDEAWTAEIFVPWSVIAMPATVDGARTMAFQISRTVAKLGERWAYPALPNTRPRFISALQPMTLQHVEPRQEYSFYPYASAAYDGERNEAKTKVGGDVFWRPSSNFQLSATINPDFGQVEADDVVVNLTAFETFFPEKRLFFLEGQEVFDNGSGGGGPPSGRRGGGGFGNNLILLNSNFSNFNRTLVFTRRMGTSVGTRRFTPDLPSGWTANQRDIAQPVDLYGAVKVIGQEGPWRYGVLAAAEDDASFRATRNGVTRVFNAPGRDYGIGRLIYEDTEGGGRRSFGWITTYVNHPARAAMVNAFDVATISASGQWQMDGQLITSDVEGTDGYGALATVRYAPRRGVNHRVGFEYYDEDVDISDFGFLRRRDSMNFVYNFALNESGLEHVRERDTFVFARHEHNSQGLATRSALFARRGWGFYDNSRLFVTLDVFPEQWDDLTSRGNGPYRVHSKVASSWTYTTDSSKPLSFDYAFDVLQEDRGDFTYGAGVALNWRPADNVAMQFVLRAAKRDGWLVYQTGREMTTFEATEVAPRLVLETFLTARQQLKFQLQWVGVRADEQERFLVPLRQGRLIPKTRGPNEASDDFTISDTVLQLRYRWELAPLSELFIVYNRGGRLLGSGPEDEFDDLFGDSLSRPFGNLFVVKLRYRLGS